MKLSKLFMAIGAVAALSFNASGAISVGINGVGPLTFDTLPTVADGWSTITNTGASADIATAAALDTQVNTNVASAILTPLGSSTTTNGISAFAIARWNGALHVLQTPPTGVGYVSLLATLQNDSGAPISQITVSYDLGQDNATVAGIVPTEEIPGHRVYFSLTGAAGSWTEVPGLDTPNSAFTGSHNATIAVGSWAAGAPLYLLFADDNAAANRDNVGAEEGGYTIDNFAVSVGSTIVAITAPGNNASIAFGTPISIDATATMPGTVLNVAFRNNGVLLGNDTTAPYNFVYNSAPLGGHDLTVVANDSLGNIRTSTVVHVTVVPNAAATVAISNPGADEMIISSNVLLYATAADADGSVASVQFKDGNASIGPAMTTAPFKFNYRPVSAGVHTFTAVATDNLGLQSTSAPVKVTMVQPLNSLVPWDGTWKFLDDGSDQGNNWFAVSDTSWASGAAELGYGDNDEVTLVGFGPNANTKYPTTYFKYHFNVANPGAISSVAVRLRVDDGAVVYLNGQPIIIQDMTNDLNEINFQSLATATVEDDLVTGYLLTVNQDIGPLLSGDNVVAVEVHQASVTSSDISLDLELIPNPGINPPVVAMVTPTNGQVFVAPDPVNATAVAMDKDGGIISVQFMVDGTPVGAADTAPPYAGSAASAVGTHVISAVALDNAGLMSTSSVTITVAAGPVVTMLVNSNEVWSYLDNGTDQGTAWQALNFDITGWGSGPAELGYGDVAPEPIEATMLGFGPDANNKYITYYFRKLFNVTDSANMTNLIVRLQRDDGGVVYINGTEVFRDNMPAGPINYLTLAGANIISEAAFFSTNVSPSVLHDGQNIVAVEIHQVNGTSSDIGFDLQLESVSPPGPGRPHLTITLATPTSATISWTPNPAPGYRLIQADNITGPWTQSPSQVNGQSVGLPGLKRFYQLVNP